MTKVSSGTTRFLHLGDTDPASAQQFSLDSSTGLIRLLDPTLPEQLILYGNVGATTFSNFFFDFAVSIDAHHWSYVHRSIVAATGAFTCMAETSSGVNDISSFSPSTRDIYLSDDSTTNVIFTMVAECPP